MSITLFQSNIEGELVDKIQEARKVFMVWLLMLGVIHIPPSQYMMLLRY